MIKAVLFDYDGVLTLDKSGSYTICKYIAAAAGVDYEAFSAEIRIRHLFDSFRNTPVNLKMFELVKNVKHTHKTALITDNKKDRMDAVSAHQKLPELFDVITVSAVIGTLKDAEPIFKKTVTELGVAFGECVFVDNQEKNLIVPKKLGSQTVFFDQKKNDVKALARALKEHGVEIK